MVASWLWFLFFHLAAPRALHPLGVNRPGLAPCARNHWTIFASPSVAAHMRGVASSGAFLESTGIPASRKTSASSVCPLVAAWCSSEEPSTSIPGEAPCFSTARTRSTLWGRIWRGDSNTTGWLNSPARKCSPSNDRLRLRPSRVNFQEGFPERVDGSFLVQCAGLLLRRRHRGHPADRRNDACGCDDRGQHELFCEGRQDHGVLSRKWLMQAGLVVSPGADRRSWCIVSVLRHGRVRDSRSLLWNGENVRGGMLGDCCRRKLTPTQISSWRMLAKMLMDGHVRREASRCSFMGFAHRSCLPV